MKHNQFSSTDFQQNLKWVNDLLESKRILLDVKHTVKKDAQRTYYTTTVQFQ